MVTQSTVKYGRRILYNSSVSFNVEVRNKSSSASHGNIVAKQHTCHDVTMLSLIV